MYVYAHINHAHVELEHACAYAYKAKKIGFRWLPDDVRFVSNQVLMHENIFFHGF